jgi:hypothetical protein
MPAKTIDSYRDTLYAVMDLFHPKTVLEYGPGESTMMILMCRSVEYVRSIEHDPFWLEKFKTHGLAIDLVFQPDLEKYPYEIGDRIRYDLVFVDGRSRVKCLEQCKLISDLVIMHDADRGKYKESINSFKFVKFTDEGNTVVLTDNPEVYEKIKDLNL